FAVPDIDISYPCGNFTAHDDPAMAVLHFAVFHYDIFTWDIHPPPFIVPARFYGNTVVPGIKGTVGNMDIFGILGITSVVIGAMAPYRYPIHPNIIGFNRMDY